MTKTKRKSFIIHIDSLTVLDDLTNEQAGELFKAIKSYHLDEDLELSSIIKIAFSPFKTQFIRDNEKYEKTCKARAEAGSKGGKQKVANASKCKQSVANLADSDNKNKSDSDSDSDSENDSNIIKSSKDDLCPHQEIINLYHEALPMMPKVKEWTPARQSKLRARWKEGKNSIEYWKGLFEYISKSDFLCGRTEKPFTCNLEWIISPKNITKIIEGNYENERN